MSQWHLNSEFKNGELTDKQTHDVGLVLQRDWSFCFVIGLYQLHEPKHGPLRKKSEGSWNPKINWFMRSQFIQQFFGETLLVA
jgi:hypothetical protein